MHINNQKTKTMTDKKNRILALRFVAGLIVFTMIVVCLITKEISPDRLLPLAVPLLGIAMMLCFLRR